MAAKSRNLTLGDSGMLSWISDAHTRLSCAMKSTSAICHKSPHCNFSGALRKTELGFTANERWQPRSHPVSTSSHPANSTPAASSPCTSTLVPSFPAALESALLCGLTPKPCRSLPSHDLVPCVCLRGCHGANCSVYLSLLSKCSLFCRHLLQWLWVPGLA